MAEEEDNDPLSALSKAEGLSSYDMSWTDWVAQKLLGDSKPSTWKSNVVQNITGSTGLGPTGYLSAKDFVPVVGQVLNAQQAYHDDKSWPEVALNLVPGMSVAGRQAMLAEHAAARALPKAVDNTVDLARRSLFAPRAKIEEPSVTVPVTEKPDATPSETSFLNRPVSRRDVNEGLIGAGAAAVVGPTVADDLIRSAVAPAADNVVVPVVKSAARAAPDVIRSSVDKIISQRLTPSNSVLKKYLDDDSINSIESLYFDSTLGDPNHSVEAWQVIFDPKYTMSGVDSKSRRAVVDEMTGDIRAQLEKDLGYALPDDEFYNYLRSSVDTRSKFADIRRDVDSIINGGDEHPAYSQFESMVRSMAKYFPSDKPPTKAQMGQFIRENYTPEGLLKYGYGVDEKDITKVLEMPIDGGVVRDHVEGIINDAVDAGFIDDMWDFVNANNLRTHWKESAAENKIFSGIKTPDDAMNAYNELLKENDALVSKFKKNKEKFESKYGSTHPDHIKDYANNREALVAFNDSQNSLVRKWSDLSNKVEKLRNRFDNIPEDKLPSMYDR